MFRMFSFLPPIGSYVLALGVMGGTYYLQSAMLASNPDTDVNKIWLVGGILAFLLAFGGFQRGLEQKSEAMQPRVSSADVMQKLASRDGDMPEVDLEMPSHMIHRPEGDSPLARVRARSNPRERSAEFETSMPERQAPDANTPLARVRARSNPAQQF